MTDTQQLHGTAGKLAQLLGEVIVHHTPHTARINTEEHYRQLELWLEDLESHTSSKITPFLTELLEHTSIPPSLEPIVREAIETPAQFSAIVTQLFLYGIVSQLLSTSVQPFLQGVSNDLWTKAVADQISVPLSPATIATAAARGLQLGAPPTVKMPQWAYDRAAESGVSAEDMDLMASIVGTPPSPQELMEMIRRKIIDVPRAKQGLMEGDTRDDWVDELLQLTHTWPTPLDFVRAAVQTQMPYDQARQWAQDTGLDVTTNIGGLQAPSPATDDMFGLLFSIAGRPPGPVELADMALRGIIPETGKGADITSFEQGIAESDVKTKWTTALWKLAQYLPPPAQIGTLLTHGAITHAQAVQLWEQRGVPTELANAYAYEAEQQHIGQDKLLAKNEVLTAYYDQLIDRPTALDYLGQLGYRDRIAQQILAIQDFKRTMRAINSVVSRISTEYQNYRISAADAKVALTSVGLPADQAQQILMELDAVRVAPLRVPTTREIGLAVKEGAITQAEGLDELAKLGYQPRDAWIVLSAHAGALTGTTPPPGSTVTG